MPDPPADTDTDPDTVVPPGGWRAYRFPVLAFLTVAAWLVLVVWSSTHWLDRFPRYPVGPVSFPGSGPAARLELLKGAAARLAPGGVLLVKETDTTPRWKHRLAAAQEHVSTKVLRITAGSDLDFASSQELEAVLAGEGLRTEVVRLDRHQVHPHVLIAGTRPEVGGDGRTRGTGADA